MLIKIIIMALGIILAAAGIVFWVKEKEDPESRKIYMITTIIGLVIAVLFAVLLLA